MSLLNELTSSIPGIDEAMCLGYIMKLVNQLDFSCVIFDTAPTGHTLRLLNFPNILGKGLEKMISLKTKFTGIFESVGTLMNQNLDQNFDKLFHSLDTLKENIEVINTQFKDNVIFLFYFRLKQLLLLCVFQNFYPCMKQNVLSKNYLNMELILEILLSIKFYFQKKEIAVKCAYLE